jgi:plasmid stabilization system protein ParE
VKIEISDFAKQQLTDIFNYYSKEVSEDTASKLINKIIDAIEELERLPSIGTKEPLLEKIKLNHKYIVAGNYKIIFRFKAEIIYITDIFDCRQNPSKITKRNRKK